MTSTTLRGTWQEVKLDRNLKQTTTHQRVVFNFHRSKIIIDQLFLKAEIEEKLLTPAPKISRRIVNLIIYEKSIYLQFTNLYCFIMFLVILHHSLMAKLFEVFSFPGRWEVSRWKRGLAILQNSMLISFLESQWKKSKQSFFWCLHFLK